MPNENNSPALAPLPELLMIFWESHSPGRCPWSRQYQAAIFYHNEVQKRSSEKRNVVGLLNWEDLLRAYEQRLLKILIAQSGFNNKVNFEPKGEPA